MKVDGVKWSLGMNSLIGPTFPESMIPSNIKEMLQSDNYEVQFVCSEYSSATDECNAQLACNSGDRQRIQSGIHGDR